jgi:hypothetical protein
MFKSALKKIFLSLAFVLSSATAFATVDSPTANSNAEYSDYAPLLQNHEFNDHDNFDGITCGVIVLNSLNVNTLGSSELGEQTLFTQENIFTPAAKNVVDPDAVQKNGTNLNELSSLLKVHGVKTKVEYSHIMTEEALKESVVQTVNNPNVMMIVHFDQGHLSLKTGDTFAVVAGYNEKDDAVLLMNVNPHGKSTTWVKTSLLLKSLQALDNDSCPRGFLLVSK